MKTPKLLLSVLREVMPKMFLHMIHTYYLSMMEKANRSPNISENGNRELRYPKMKISTFLGFL